MTDVTIRRFQLRRSFTPGYRPASLAEGEALIQFADQKWIFGGYNGGSLVEIPFASTGGGGTGGTSYTLPPAAATALGGVKANVGTAGQFVTGIASDGSLTYGTPSVGGTSYTLPAATSSALGGIKTGAPGTGKFVTGFDANGTALYAVPATGSGAGTPLTLTRQVVTPTAGQTVFPITGGYTPGNILVFVDSTVPVSGVDYTATNGSSVTINSPALGTSDVVEFVVFSGGSVSSGASGPSSTDALPEGTSNLYFTQGRARSAIAASGSLSYSTSTGVLSYTTPSTDGVVEGSTNLYFTAARARGAISVSGSLAYNAATGVISYTAPAAYALPAATSSALGGIKTGTPGSGKFVSGFDTDGTALYATPATGGPSSTDALPEGTSNLYFTAARARAAISVSGSLSYSAATGVISYTAPALAAVATSGSASDLGIGTLPAARLPASGATVGTYGSGSQIPVVTVDATGRITGISTVANSGGGGGGGNVSASGTFAVGDVVGANTTDGTSVKSLGQPGPLVRGFLSGTAGIAYVASTGVFSLAAPSTTVLGGVLSKAAGTNQFSTGIDTSGTPTFAQPAFSNLAGSATAAQMPAFSGDATSSAGTTVLTLAASGVTAGSYTGASITVDAKGRVTSAANGPAARYDLAPFCVGQPSSAAEPLLDFIAPVAISYPAGLTGSLATATTAAASSAVWSLTRNGTQVGTVTFAAGATTGTFAAASSFTLAVGDRLRLLAPSPTDSTLADITFTLAGTR